MKRCLLRCIAALIGMTVFQAAIGAQASQEALYQDAINAISDGHPQAAIDRLTRLIGEQPQHAGAWLDLAILFCQLGQSEKALRLFDQIESRFTPPPAIMEVMARQRLTGCRPPPPRQNVVVAIARGHESNANQGAQNASFRLEIGGAFVDLPLASEYLPQGDGFTNAGVDFSREITPGSTTAFASLQARGYDTLRQFDTVGATGGVEHSLRLGKGILAGAAALSSLTLGGNRYQQSALAQARYTPDFEPAGDWRTSLIVNVAKHGFPANDRFDALVTDARAAITFKPDERRFWQASAGRIADRAGAERPGGHRDGWLLQIDARWPLFANSTGQLLWSRQVLDSEQAYLPGLINTVRRQDTWSLRAAVVVPILREHALRIELRDVRSRDNISLFAYQARSLMIGWQWQPAQ